MALREATIRLNVEQPAIALKVPEFAPIKKFKTEFLSAHKAIVNAVASGETAIRSEYAKTAMSILRLIKLDRQRAAESQRNAIRVSAIQSGGRLTSTTLAAAQATASTVVGRFAPIQVPRKFGGVAAGRGVGSLGGSRLIGGTGTLARTAETFFPEIGIGRRALGGIPGIGSLTGGIGKAGAALGGGALLGGAGLAATVAAAPVGFFLAQNHANKQHGKFLDDQLAEVTNRRNEESRRRIVINNRSRDDSILGGKRVQNSLFGQDPLKASAILGKRANKLQGSIKSDSVLGRINGQSQEAFASGLAANLVKQRELLGVKQQQLTADQQIERTFQGRLKSIRQEVLLSNKLLQNSRARLLGTRAQLGALDPIEKNKLKRIDRKVQAKEELTTDELLFVGQYGDKGKEFARKNLVARSGPQELVLESILGIQLEEESEGLEKRQDTAVRRDAAVSGLFGDEVDEARKLAADGNLEGALEKSDTAQAAHRRRVATSVNQASAGIRTLKDRLLSTEEELENVVRALERLTGAFKDNNAG